MSSFTSGFRAVLAAVTAILVIEAAIFAVHPSSFVERSNYLDWNYGTPEIFHKAMIYQKLDDFAYSSPDIVQVGDSSGLHGVNPDVVTKYLGGLKYVNLGSIANAGFDGQYAIAEFMFRRNPGIKALVLYVTLNQLPNVDMTGGDQSTGGADRIRESFVAPWAYLNPPSMALRRQVTDAVYSRWGTLRPRQARFFDVGEVFSDMLVSIREHFGWWPEHDPRFAGARLRNYWRQFCDDSGIRVYGDGDRFYLHDPILGKRSYFRAYLQRFADLAASYGAKLVIIFHPYPCSKLEGDFLSARKADLKAVRDSNPNVVYRPEAVFEPWPMAAFITYDHLRAGYDERNFERVGRFLADALGVGDGPRGRAEKPRGPPAESPRPDPRSVLAGLGRAGGATAEADGASIGPSPEREGAASTSVRIVESGGYGPHLARIDLKDLLPDGRYAVSAIVKPIGARGLRLEILDSGSSVDRGNVQCDMNGLEAVRGAQTPDAGLDALPDGWMRCWLVPAATPAHATLSLVVLNESGQRAYVGDGTSGILLKDVTIQPWQRPRVEFIN
jgi:hypothetical protein